MKLKRLLLTLSLLCAPFAFAATIKSSAPPVYTVKSGDTLWELASIYIDEPWQWKRIWNQNRQITNPDKIYPGDEIHIVNGNLVYKRKHVQRKGRSTSGGLRTVKLSPELREVPLEAGIPAVSYNAVKTSLVEGEIMMLEMIKKLPYVVGIESKGLTGKMDGRAYIKGDVTPGKTYDMYRQEMSHNGPVLGDVRKGRKRKQVEIGTELLKTGTIVIERVNDGIASGFIKGISHTGIREGNYLIEQDGSGGIPNLYFDPKPAPQGTEAQIVSMPNRLLAAGIAGSVIINRGFDAGLEPGDVLLVQTESYFTDDPHNAKKKVQIPGEAAGTIMVYKVFDRMSMAIVMSNAALKPIKVGYNAVTPFSALP